MNERDLWWKIVLVGGLVALGIASVFPLDEKIKYGIDLYGGYSLLYEIDDTGLGVREKDDLSERVIKVLQDRVDPRGVYNLVWRPVGHNRIEIQMPRPREELADARQEYEVLKQEIQKTRLRRSQILAAVAIEDPTARATEFKDLAGRIESRIPLLEATAAKYQEYQAEDKAYQARVERVQADQLTAEAVRAAVEKPASERPAAIEAMIGEAAARKGLLKRAADAWDELQAARATTQLGATTQDAATTRPADADVDQLQKKYDTLVSRVVAANPDPDTLREGVTIDTVIEKEGVFQNAVGEVLDRRIDRNALERILSSKPEKRTERLETMIGEYPGMAESIKKMVAMHDSLREKGGGQGRLEDPEDLQRLLRGAGVLEFRILAELDPADPKKYDRFVESLQTRGPRRRPGEEDFQWFEIENVNGFLDIKQAHKNFEANKNKTGVICEQLGDKYYVLSHIGESYSLIHAAGGRDWQLKSARADVDQNGRPAIAFTLDELGGSKFYVLTRENLKRQLAIFLDDFAVSHATIISAIRTNGQISGSFTSREVQEAVKKLEAGSLPRKLKEPPISVRSIGPSLGKANREAGLRAATYGGIAVAIFVLIYYFYAGGIAITAVAMNILFIGAMMSTLGATLTLPGIAGLVLAIGMAVDANVLINERIREELARGTALRMAIKLGYERAFSAILDS
ncbi:MAG: SecD/SecF family protein translocase subunit, partial [Planctomycetota bacterium]|nr:SecD/SecF family protein translocase subunit [Planctomycetota bacterium]